MQARPHTRRILSSPVMVKRDAYRAVLDVGKTHVRVSVFDRTGKRVAHRETANRSRIDERYGYLAHDTAALQTWLIDNLTDLQTHWPLEAIVPTAHGAAVALVKRDGLALPVMDYEFDDYAQIDDAYRAAIDPFEETLTPLLPAGLNIGRQLFWLQQAWPAEFAAAEFILPYAQYWSWWLSGVAASEVSSLGCHSHLWSPVEGSFTGFVRRQGWSSKLAPLASARHVLGYVRPELARMTGVDARCAVYTGSHDSNSCLARYRSTHPRTTLVSSGTWTVIMALDGSVDRLDAHRDMLGNVTVDGMPVPTARFMGGREFAALAGGVTVPASVDALREVVARGAMALPSFADKGGPWPGCRGRLIDADDLTEAQRVALASLYCAQMTAYLIDELSGAGPVVVAGPFARNAAYLAALAALLPAGVACFAESGPDGTEVGAWLLSHPEGEVSAMDTLVAIERVPVARLERYDEEWRSLLQTLGQGQVVCG